jgi:3-methyladenine DNA glycosylase AlkD
MKKRAKTTKSVTTSPKAAKRTPAKKSQTVAPKSQKKPVSASKSAATTQTSGRMTLVEVMAILESLGSEQTRRTWTRHGAPEPMFGVLFGELYKLMKRIDVDHELAQQLWATGNVDARNLAMKIADPAIMTPAELTQWAIENPMRMCNLYIATLAAEGPHARVLLKEWLGSSNALLLASGWTLLGRLSDLDPSFSEQELLRGIGEIEKSIHSVANAVRSDMNRTLITIGGRSPALRKAVVAAAKRIGSVKVDHGDTACKTPQIEESLRKAWARSEAKYGSPAAHERSMKSMRRRC